MCKDGTNRKTKFVENSEIFRCPICEASMNVREFKDIICSEGHSFNIARKGYINFLLKAVKTDYDSDMFYSRSMVCASGFFDPLIESISNLIINKTGEYKLTDIKILDAGCGDGSHVGQIIKSICSMTTMNLQGFGVDISKEGILLASKQYFDIIWCVADLTNLPFMSKGFNVILNILSPANYDEFHRTLKDNGILIKVVPGSNYLKELRDIFYDGTDKAVYSNDEVIEHYSSKFKILDVSQVKYSHKIDKEELMHLIRMTPLSWTVTDERVRQVVDMNITNISADFTIIIGGKR